MPLADGRIARVVMTDRRHGDLAVAPDSARLEARRRAIVDGAWTWLQQVHGTRVVTVGAPGDHAGAIADGACTTVSFAPLAVQVADCAPIALVSEHGAIAVLHAGWRGLVAGIVAAGADALAALDAPPTRALVGPCIGPASYAFGSEDLERVVEALGVDVGATTRWGTTALHLPAAVGASLERAGIDDISFLPGCTATDAELRWSHRARGDVERQAMVVWIEEPLP